MKRAFVALTALAGMTITPANAVLSFTPSANPAVVQVVVGDMRCTGTLISPEWVLTAHHCLTGATPMVVTTTGQTITTTESHRHPNADLGVVKINSPIAATPIPLSPSNLHPGENGTIIGYGGLNSRQPNQANVTVNARVDQVPDEHGGRTGVLIQAASTNGLATHGDSGGPLLDEHGLAGVISGIMPTSNLSFSVPVAEQLAWLGQFAPAPQASDSPAPLGTPGWNSSMLSS